MRRLTGTHVYSLLSCPRKVALDLHGDRDLRRARTEAEEFVLRRGRELEDRIVATLDVVEPDYPERDHEAGAAATLELMREGVAGIAQGVLLGDGRLGIPDLLRREPGASDLGAHHYVVGDIKSSREPRADQILQIAFYDRLLQAVQGRPAEYVYLIVKDGTEHRFDPRDFAEALDDVEEQLRAILERSEDPRPFSSRVCRSCVWSELCGRELAEADDLSLLDGMTRGLRGTLERAGFASCTSLVGLAAESAGRAARIESAQLRRLVKAAGARGLGAPVAERAPAPSSLAPGAFVHLLRDAFEDRVLYFGILWADAPGGERWFDAEPRRREDEWSAFAALVRELPGDVRLLHYGDALPRWYEDNASSRTVGIELEARMIDLARRLRGAATYPGPIFGLEDHVRRGLGRDPQRIGDAAAAGLFADRAGWLRAKGRSDLGDMAVLRRRLLEGECVHGPEP